MDRWISPASETWPAPDATAAAIAKWESDTGLRLPADYRAFMLRCDGGRPYPNIFAHTARDPGDFPNPTESYLDPLYRWARVVAWSAELGNRLPPRTLAIGADAGLLEILLSLREEDHGAVYSWVRNWGAWGNEENDYLCPQASTFAGFVTSLTDDEEKNGYDYWHTPQRERLQRELVV